MKSDIRWEPVISSAEKMPADIDTDSSAFVVYIRKDIVPYEEFDDQGTQTFKGWKYLEAKVDNSDWIADQLKEQKENNEAIMLAVADLYTMQLGAE